MRPPRILRLITRLNAGGPTRHAVWLAEGLRARGWETMLAAGPPVPGEDDLRCLARERRVEVRDVPALSRRVRVGADAAAVAEVVRLIRDFDPTILHTHTSKAGAVGRVAAAIVNASRRTRERVARVHTFHGHVLEGYFSPLAQRAVRAAEAGLGRFATEAAIALTESQRHELVGRFRVCDSGSTHVVPLGLDLEPFERPPSREPLRGEWKAAPGDFLVGIVGRIAPVKDHELFLEAAARLRARLATARFVVVGGGDGVEPLRRRAAALGLGEAVVFAGTRFDLPQVYTALDAVALSSRNEGTPLSLLEAMAAGRPIVATDVGGVRDLLTREWRGGVFQRVFQDSEKPRGLLVPAGDAEGLARNLATLAATPALAAELAAAGRAYAFRFHTLERLVCDLDELYRSLIG